MCPEALDEALSDAKAAGQVPFIVVATSGSTVVGSFDPVVDIARVCRGHDNVWLHIDAAWGFPLLWSRVPSCRQVLSGLELADSVTWNPHKLLGAPLQATIFVTRHAAAFRAAHAASAAYLFHPDQAHASYDLGDLSLFCGRTASALKVCLLPFLP